MLVFQSVHRKIGKLPRFFVRRVIAERSPLGAGEGEVESKRDKHLAH